jgi:hypothetical protein
MLLVQQLEHAAAAAAASKRELDLFMIVVLYYAQVQVQVQVQVRTSLFWIVFPSTTNLCVCVQVESANVGSDGAQIRDGACLS